MALSKAVEKARTDAQGLAAETLKLAEQALVLMQEQQADSARISVPRGGSRNHLPAGRNPAARRGAARTYKGPATGGARLAIMVSQAGQKHARMIAAFKAFVWATERKRQSDHRRAEQARMDEHHAAAREVTYLDMWIQLELQTQRIVDSIKGQDGPVKPENSVALSRLLVDIKEAVGRSHSEHEQRTALQLVAEVQALADEKTADEASALRDEIAARLSQSEISS